MVIDAWLRVQEAGLRAMRTIFYPDMYARHDLIIEVAYLCF